MNGGFALKLASARERVLDELRAIAADEHLDLVELGPQPHVPLDDDPGFCIGVGAGTRAGETLVIPADHGSDHAAWLEGLGEALAARLGCPTSYVVDSDEGCELLRAWNGGESLSPDTGRPAWDRAGHRRFAVAPPSHVALPDREASALIPRLERALPASVLDIGTRIAGLARRDARGPVGRAVESWRVSLAIPDRPTVHAVVSVLAGVDLAARVAWEVSRRLDRVSELAARRVDVTASPLRDAVAGRIAAEVEVLERAGFGVVTWYVRVRFDGEPATLECTTFQPGETVDDELAELVDEVRAVLGRERQRRGTAARASLDAILHDQLARGDLDAAAATYRELHAAYFATVDEERAIATSRAKVSELVRLGVR